MTANKLTISQAWRKNPNRIGMAIIKSKLTAPITWPSTYQVDLGLFHVQLALYNSVNPAPFIQRNNNVAPAIPNAEAQIWITPNSGSSKTSKMGRRKLPIDVANVLEMRNAEKSLSEIGRFHKISKRTVGRILKGERTK